MYDYQAFYLSASQYVTKSLAELTPQSYIFSVVAALSTISAYRQSSGKLRLLSMVLYSLFTANVVRNSQLSQWEKGVTLVVYPGAVELSKSSFSILIGTAKAILNAPSYLVSCTAKKCSASGAGTNPEVEAEMVEYVRAENPLLEDFIGKFEKEANFKTIVKIMRRMEVSKERLSLIQE